MTSKIIPYSKLPAFSAQVRKQGKKLVLVTGVFDLLHSAHREFLKRAKQQGDVLVVGLEPDERVRALKGKGRPKDLLPVRLDKVSQVEAVDWVFSLPLNFGELSEQEKLIAMVSPDILAASSHTPYLREKVKLLERYGGKVEVVMQRNKSVSTTLLLQRRNPKQK